MVASGESTEAAAVEKIQEARTRVAQVNELIAQFGESNMNRSLSHRVAHALTLQSKTAERTPLHDALENAMQELESFLEKEFRVV
jgi:phage gp36-like protein